MLNTVQTRSAAKKPWLDSYPKGVPAEVDVHAFASLKDMFERSCARFRDKPAFANMGVGLTFDEVDRLSREFGAYLQKVIGLSRADRVAIMLPNLLQSPVVLFGALRAGMTVVNVNPLYTASELAHQLADSGATAVVVLENFARTVEQALPKTEVRHVVTTQVGDLFPPVKRLLVNFVVKQRAANGPGVAHSRCRLPVRMSLPPAQGRRSTTSRSVPTTSRSCSTPAAPRDARRGRSSPTATWWRTSSKPRRGSGAP